MPDSCIFCKIIAGEIPGKEVYFETIRYFEEQLAALNVEVHKNHKVGMEDLRDVYADDVVFATGVVPRMPDIQGVDHFSVMNYETAIKNKSTLKDKVAIIGAGGIGFDVAEFLVTGDSPTLDLPEWLKEWGVADPEMVRGGLAPEGPQPDAPVRQVTLIQRKSNALGKGLGKTTGWIHRAGLKMNNVQMIADVNYERIGDEGLLVSYGYKRENTTWIDVDHIVMCAGQVPLRELEEPLREAGIKTNSIDDAELSSYSDSTREIVLCRPRPEGLFNIDG